MKVLNLYAGLGGNRKKWQNVEVTAIEFDKKIADVYSKLYPNDKVIVADAHEYLLDNFENFDFIWSSPPCQSHSKMVKATRHKIRKYPNLKLYEEIIFLDNFFKGTWIVENVVPYYKPLIEPKLRVGRHLFWSNKEWFGIQDIKRPSGFINKSNLKGKEELMTWLGIYFEEKLYYQNNHCPCQVLRNCVHPNLGVQFING